jgi:hypothetical protein
MFLRIEYEHEDSVGHETAAKVVLEATCFVKSLGSEGFGNTCNNMLKPSTNNSELFVKTSTWKLSVSYTARQP